DLEPDRERPEAREAEGRETARIGGREITDRDALLRADRSECPVCGREEPVAAAERGQPPASVPTDPCRCRDRRDRRGEPRSRDERPRERRGAEVLRMSAHETQEDDRVDER